MFGAFQTFGKLGAIGKAISAAWSPSALWPTGTEPGMWISPRTLDSQWQDSTGTTPVSTPGTVADSSNPVGLALDLRLGAPTTLGPELVVNGDFSNGSTDWTVYYGGSLISFASNRLEVVTGGDFLVVQSTPLDTTKMYLLEWDQNVSGSGRFIMYLGQNGEGILSGYGVGHRQFIVHPSSPANGLYLTQSGLAAGDWIDNISVREVPGNHMLQATSTARPLGSARVNLLTYTENFEGATWKGSGSTGADILDWPVGQDKYQWLTLPANTPVRIEFDYSVASGPDGTFSIALLNGATQNINATPTVQRYSGVHSTGTTNPYFLFGKVSSGTAFRVSRMSVVREADGALPYQAILTDGSAYTATDFPIFQKYDGVDDGMATASFAAGTLSNAMDCLIAVRRDSGANAVCGLYESVSDANKVFGIAESGSGSGCVGSGAGTPTVWVDGVQLTGGTAVTRGTLHAALTVGDWHILELRGLDLSTWTAAGAGLYTSYVLNGAQGGILLFPGGNTAGRDAARTWLGAKVGLTL